MGTRLRPAVIALVAVIAMGGFVRMHGLTDPPLKFHATRQYHGLNGARAFYLRWTPSAPEWQRRVAIANQRADSQLEPPILEVVTAVGYKVLGGERIWLGRLLSMLAWVGGSVALFAVARRLLQSDAVGVVAAAVMMLLPYTIESSRSFQPDPLAISLTVVAMWLLVRYDDEPSPRRLLVAAAVAGAAVLVKGVAAPYLFLVLLALMVARYGWRRGVTQPALWGFWMLALVPAGLYYAVGYFTGGALRGAADSSFIPSMLRTSEFWEAWARQLDTVTTWRFAVIAFAMSLLLAREKRVRFLMGALWLAYFLVGLAVSYRTASHAYYHLTAVPVIALGTAVGIARIGFGRALVAGVFVAILAFAVSTEPSPLSAKEKARTIGQAREIGRAVDHSTHILFLGTTYGKPLEYHGRVANITWPTNDDLKLERLQGLRPMSATERFRVLSRRIDGAEWFVVTDTGELEIQPDLGRLLSGYKVAVRRETYVIYDLRVRV